MPDDMTGTVSCVFEDHVMQITVDRVAKRNALTPLTMAEFGKALSNLNDDPGAWVGVLCFGGEHSTAGLDMSKFFGPDSDVNPKRETGQVDPFGLGRRCRKPLVCAVQGITYTVGIKMMLACDVVVAASDSRFCQMEAKRGIALFGGATLRFLQRMGWGNAMYHLLLCDELDAEEALRVGLVQEVVDPGEQIACALELARAICGEIEVMAQSEQPLGKCGA